MGIFSSISNAIFGDDEEEKKAEAAPAAAPAAAPKKKAPIEIAELEKRIAAIPSAEGLDWKNSIVDLMKAVRIDPSYANRKELAGELGIAGYEGTAEQNIALHKAVLTQMAAAGGKVPDDMKG